MPNTARRVPFKRVAFSGNYLPRQCGIATSPEHCLRRGDSWIFSPEAPYERYGDVDNVVFPCGYTLGPDGDKLNLYYSGADSCIALATGSVRQMLDWLKRDGLS